MSLRLASVIRYFFLFAGHLRNPLRFCKTPGWKPLQLGLYSKCWECFCDRKQQENSKPRSPVSHSAVCRFDDIRFVLLPSPFALQAVRLQRRVFRRQNPSPRQEVEFDRKKFCHSVLCTCTHMHTHTPTLILRSRLDKDTVVLWDLMWGAIRTRRGHCGTCQRNGVWGENEICDLGDIQTGLMSHIVDSCLLTKHDGGLQRLHTADKADVDRLSLYGTLKHTKQIP